MDAIELLTTRRSCVVAKMTEPGPDDATLTTILQAGLRVPDHGQLHPWRIQIVDKAGQAALGDLCAEVHREHDPGATEDELERERRRPQRAPVLLVVTNRIDPDARIPTVEQHLSGGALCMNLLNAAHALGFVAQWLTEWPVYDERIRRALGHQAHHEMIGWIHIGSAAEPPAERARATLADVVSRWPDHDTPATS